MIKKTKWIQSLPDDGVDYAKEYLIYKTEYCDGDEDEDDENELLRQQTEFPDLD